MNRSRLGRSLVALVLCTLALILWIPTASGARAQRAPRPDFAAIDAHVERQMRELRIPGLALAVVQGGQVVHLKGFGVAGPDGTAVTAQTPFQFASITKPMTAVAVMQLVEAGTLDLDTPVQQYIPWFRVADPVASARITPRHLLYHTSGLPEALGTEYALRGDPRPGAIEARVRALATVQLSRPPGQAYGYSNAGYMVLGLLIQTVSGQPYSEYMHEQVFAPLQMRNTVVDWDAARRHGAATGHRFWFGRPVPGQLAVDQALVPAGYAVSGSAEDVAHFLVAQLNGGRYGDATLLSPAGVAEMQRPVLPAGAHEAYAMDWSVTQLGGETAIIKGGSLADFKTQIVLLPERRLGLVMLMNANQYLATGLGDLRQAMLPYNVAELLLGQQPTAFAASPFPTLLYVALFAVVALQAAGMARTVLLLRRWRRRPGLRPQSRVTRLRRVGLPLLANLLWGLLALAGLPAVFGAPFSFGLYALPDLFSALLVSGVVAIIWAIVRSVLIGRIVCDRSAVGAVVALDPA